MVPIKEFSAAGVAITDEIVRCDEAVTVGAATLYRGYLQATANENIADATQSTYTAYTAASQAGTRQAVILAGYPGAANTLRVDPQRGHVYAFEVDDFYFRYLAHDPIKHNTGNISIFIPYVLTASSSITIARLMWPFPMIISHVSIGILGSNPTADATLTLSNGTESANVTIPASGSAVVRELTTALKVTAAETLTISTTDGKDAHSLNLSIMGL